MAAAWLHRAGLPESLAYGAVAAPSGVTLRGSSPGRDWLLCPTAPALPERCSQLLGIGCPPSGFDDFGSFAQLPQQGSPQQGSPQQGSPQQGSPQQGSPQQGSPPHPPPPV